MDCCGKGWRDGFAEGEVVQRIRPVYCDDYLPNPHKGTTTYQRFEGDPIEPDLSWYDDRGPVTFNPPGPGPLVNHRYVPTTISYCRWRWSTLEPEQGKLRYDVLDGALNAAMQRGQTLQIRTQPVSSDEGPEWYLKLGAKCLKEQKDLDCNDPLYLEHFGNHIRMLGERYDGHPALESFDIGYGGHWGEGGGNASYETAARLVDIYLSAFRKTPLLALLGTPGAVYAARVKPPNLGWRADCFGDLRSEGKGHVPEGRAWNHMYDAYTKEVHENGLKDAWKTAPVCFETCWTVAWWDLKNWDIDWILEQGLKHHLSIFMPKSVYIPEKWRDKIMAFNKRMGYRFHIMQMNLPLEAKAGANIETQVIIDNKGVAPIYRPYHFALRFTQGKTHHVVRLTQEIRQWMPDLTYFRENFRFPRELEQGTTEVSCGIVNDDNKPVVRLAMKPVTEDGWHPLTFMDVV